MDSPDIWEQYRKDMAALLEGFRQTIRQIIENNTSAMNRLTAAVERLGAKGKPFTASDNADFLAQADWEKATTVLGGPGAPCHASPDFDSLRKAAPEPPRTCGECAHEDACETVQASSEIAPNKCFQPREVTP